MNTPADQVMDLIFGRWRSQTLSAGTELGVFDHLDKRTAKSAETLATELNADPTLLYRLLRAQAASACSKRTAHGDSCSPARATCCARPTPNL